MRRKLAGNQYELLTPRERLGILARALARNDHAEAGKLHDTTPTKVYNCADEAFDLPFRVLWHLAYILSIQLSLYVGQLSIIRKVKKMTPAMMGMAAKETLEHVLNEIGDPSDDTGDDDGAEEQDGSVERDHQPEVAPQTRSTALFSNAHGQVDGAIDDWWNREASEASGMLSSFDRFTRQAVDVDGMTVLRAWMYPVADEVEELGILDHDPDPEMTRKWGEVWSSVWNRKLGLRPLDEGKQRGSPPAADTENQDHQHGAESTAD